jgi:uncharacterized protein (DUF169 family)
MIDANILNKQLRTGDKRLSSSLEIRLTKCYTEILTWTDSLECPKLREMDLRLERKPLRRQNTDPLFRISLEMCVIVMYCVKFQALRFKGLHCPSKTANC